jgi:hypothetical protein
VIERKKKILLLQITIFLVASFLLFNTYREKESEEVSISIESDSNTDTNSFTDVKYSGFDLKGNRYTLNAGVADFKIEKPEDINMKEVKANFFLKNGSVLKVTSDIGFYNNVTLDMNFKENVQSIYLTNTLFSDELIYSSSDGKLLATGNVRGESVERGEFFADNVEYDLINKTLDFSMFGNKQVNVKLKDQNK